MFEDRHILIGQVGSSIALNYYNSPVTTSLESILVLLLDLTKDSRDEVKNFKIFFGSFVSANFVKQNLLCVEEKDHSTFFVWPQNKS